MLVTSNHPLMSDWDKNKVGVELEELGLVFRVTVYASTPSNSGGRGDFGCLLSKCCLKVFGSGIWDCRKGRYIYFREMAQALYFADFSMIKIFNTDLFFKKQTKWQQNLQVKIENGKPFFQSWYSPCTQGRWTLVLPLLPSFDHDPWPSSSLPVSWRFSAETESSDAHVPFWQNLKRRKQGKMT